MLPLFSRRKYRRIRKNKEEEEERQVFLNAPREKDEENNTEEWVK